MHPANQIADTPVMFVKGRVFVWEGTGISLGHRSAKTAALEKSLMNVQKFGSDI
jgi:hypothetical protein